MKKNLGEIIDKINDDYYRTRPQDLWTIQYNPKMDKETIKKLEWLQKELKKFRNEMKKGDKNGKNPMRSIQQSSRLHQTSKQLE